jgi:hypothetical protein
MALSRDTTAAAPAGVSFEVERFAWADGRLEVTGRWYGIRGRRFLRPTLDVEVDGVPRRILAVLEHKPWAADDGEEWTAAFDWTGEPVELASAELAVAPELAVELPAPAGAPAKKSRPVRSGGERLQARPPRAQALEAELAAARAEIDDLRDRLAAEQRARERRVEQVEALREESATARAEAEAERDRALAARDEAVAARDAVLAERAEMAAARDAAARERDEAVAGRDAARAEAEKAGAERDRIERRRAALETELAAVAKARDKARAERNELMTRAGAADAPARGRRRRGRDRPGAAGDEAAPPAGSAPPEGRPTQAGAAAQAPGGGAPDPPPRGGVPAPAPPPRKSQIPPGGILLPPSGPGTHQRRSVLPGWAPRVLAPILLVVLVLVIALLIAWAT